MSRLVQFLKGAAGATTFLVVAAPAAAQLRPLDPAPWRLFDPGVVLTADLGASVLQHQRASLAGTEGRLVEVGNFHFAWRAGRVGLEAAGTALRRFDDQSTFTNSEEGTLASRGPHRRDAGDIRISTLVRLTPEHFPMLGILRFGTRLPTTDNQEGLGRDRTDFFALLGAHVHARHLSLAGEAGISINGTRDPDFEQMDLLVYDLSAEFDDFVLLSPTITWAGQRNTVHGWRMRGTEDLSELRIGVRTGGRLAAHAEWVKGLATFSPSSGLRLALEYRH